MFDFTGRWSRGRFIISIAISIVAFIALTVVFPFALVGFANATNCGSTGGACGAVGLLFSVIVKPLVFGLFFLSLIAPLAGRLRDIGVSPWLSLFVLLMVAADNAFLQFSGAPWSFAFSAGVLNIEPPVYLLAALALMVVLAIVPPRDGRVSLRALGWPAVAMLAIAAPVAIAASYRIMWSLPGLVTTILPVVRVIQPVVLVGSYALFVLPFAAAFALWPRDGQDLDTTPVRDGPPIPFVRLALAALALAIVLVLSIGPNGFGVMWLLMLPAAMVPLVLPNAVLFFVVLLTIYLWVKRPSWVPAVLTVALVAIYGSWGYQHYLAANVGEIDARDIAAIPVYEPPTMPRAILITGSRMFGDTSDFLRLMLERSDIDTIALEEEGKLVGYRYLKPEDVVVDPKTKIPKTLDIYPIAELPKPYLVLKTWSHSEFHSSDFGGQYFASSPYELRIVDGESDRLVAVWYRRMISVPTWFPIASLEGWRTEGRSAERFDREETGRQFLIAALGEAPVVRPPQFASFVKKVDAVPPAPVKKRKTLMDTLFGPDGATKPEVVTPAAPSSE
jgi:hypothetical protein